MLASDGYPGSYEKGFAIEIPAAVQETPDLHVFHAGTSRDDGTLRTSGGRVLAVTAVADSLEEAARASRTGAEAITFQGRTFRRDIGWRELARQERT